MLAVAAHGQTGEAAVAGPPSGASAALGGEQPATAVVWGREIVTFRAPYGGLGPAERAAGVQERIETTLSGNPKAPLRLKTATDGKLNGMLVLAGDEILFGILEGDLPAGRTLEGEGAAAMARVRELALAMQRQRNTKAMATSIAVSVTLLVALLLFIGLLERFLRPRLLRRLGAPPLERRPKAAPGVPGTPAPPVFDRATLEQAGIRVTLRLVLLAVEVGAAFFCSQFVLLSFPYTEPLGSQLATQMLRFAGNAAASVADSLPDLFVIVIIVLICRFLWNLVRRWTEAIEAGVLESNLFDAETARPTRLLLGVLIWVAAVVIAYPYIPGSGSDAFKGVTVLVGLMVSLGSSSIIGQLISGLVVLYSRAVRRGDFVSIEGHDGYVAEVGLLATRLMTAHRELINIPSTVMVGAVSHNATRLAEKGGAVFRTTLTIGYDTPWRQVHGMLIEAANTTPGVMANPAPRVYQRALSDFYIEYILSLQLDVTRHRGETATNLHAAILDTFNVHGVQIMSPHFEGQPENAVVVPPDRWAPPGSIATDSRPFAVAGPASPAVIVAEET